MGIKKRFWSKLVMNLGGREIFFGAPRDVEASELRFGNSYERLAKGRFSFHHFESSHR